MLLYTTWGDGGAVEVGVVVVFTHRCWTTIWEKVPRPHLCKREMWVKFYILPWVISGCITRKPSRPSFILCVPYVVLMSCLHYYAVVSWFFLTLPLCWHLVQGSIVGLVYTVGEWASNLWHEIVSSRGHKYSLCAHCVVYHEHLRHL